MATDKTEFRYESNFIDNPLKIGNTLLFQVGRRFCYSGGGVGEHGQRDYVELTAVTDGKGYVITNGVPVKVKSGDIYVSFPGDFHAIQSDEVEPLKFDYLTVRSTEPVFISKFEEIYKLFSNPKMRIIRNEYIPVLISLTISEMRKEKAFKEKVLNAAFEEILSFVCREFESAEKNISLKEVDTGTVLCYTVMNYIDTHIYTLHNLHDLSEVTGYCYNYLSNIFKKVTGDTVISYYKKRRLETARLLLLSEEGLSVSNVATLLGYSSVYTLSRAVKEQFGMSPRDLRKIDASDEYNKSILLREHKKAEEALNESQGVFNFDPITGEKFV